MKIEVHLDRMLLFPETQLEAEVLAYWNKGKPFLAASTTSGDTGLKTSILIEWKHPAKEKPDAT